MPSTKGQEHYHASKQTLKVAVGNQCPQLTIWVARGVEILEKSNGLRSHDTTFCFESVGHAAGSVAGCLPAERIKPCGLGLEKVARCSASRPLVPLSPSLVLARQCLDAPETAHCVEGAWTSCWLHHNWGACRISKTGMLSWNEAIRDSTLLLRTLHYEIL